MSNVQHAGGPWSVEARKDFGFDVLDGRGESVAICASLNMFDNHDQAIARAKVNQSNARRIVACVNACEGVELDWLEGGCTGWLNNTREERDQYQRERDEARQQREALLAALELMVSTYPYSPPCHGWEAQVEAHIAAKAAIAAAKAGAQ